MCIRDRRDIDYGIFPYTSSSTTIAAYGPIGAGIPGVQPDHVVGVLKAYSTCVGAGPFVAENAMPEEWKESLRKAGGEYGAATGRPRRVGPFDAVASRYGLKCCLLYTSSSPMLLASSVFWGCLPVYRRL